MESVLLLNSSYEPLKIITWQRAVTLFFDGKVEVVEEYDHQIRSVSLVIKAPAVVRLLRFAKFGRQSPPFSRLNVFARDRFECQYCGKSLSVYTATVDHVLPRSRGGTTSWLNVVSSCSPCNRKKGWLTPDEAGMKLRGQPTKPQWLPVLLLRSHEKIPQPWRAFFVVTK
jgi:5-methylcytosine-specific restriction endonuclease McrA